MLSKKPRPSHDTDHKFSLINDAGEVVALSPRLQNDGWPEGDQIVESVNSIQSIILERDALKKQLEEVREVIFSNLEAGIPEWAQGLKASQKTNFLPEYDPEALSSAHNQRRELKERLDAIQSNQEENSVLVRRNAELLKALEYFFASGSFLPTGFAIRQAEAAIKNNK